MTSTCDSTFITYECRGRGVTLGRRSRLRDERTQPETKENVAGREARSQNRVSGGIEVGMRGKLRLEVPEWPQQTQIHEGAGKRGIARRW